MKKQSVGFGCRLAVFLCAFGKCLDSKTLNVECFVAFALSEFSGLVGGANEFRELKSW
jgi:hypothetical protein